MKKIVVAIDLTEMDNVLVKYVALLMKSLPAATLILVHIYKKNQSNILFGESWENKNINIKDALKQEIHKKFNSVLDNEPFHWEIEVQDGEINDEILDSVKKNEADFLVMGRKKTLKGSGGMPKKTVKRSKCSVLLVPETPFQEVKKILSPTDFSEYSALAVQQALLIAGHNNGEVVCQHLYEVPSGYHKTGKDYHEFAQVMEGHAKNDTKLFLEKYSFPQEKLRFVYTLDEKGKGVKLIYNFAQSEKVDMICLGSKGRTAAASILLGSIAEGLVAINADFPLLVVKKKNENLDFFDAIAHM